MTEVGGRKKTKKGEWGVKIPVGEEKDIGKGPKRGRKDIGYRS